jgi:hypothetical protein
MSDLVNHTHLPKEVDLAFTEYLAVWVPEPVWMLGDMKSLLPYWV